MKAEELDEMFDAEQKVVIGYCKKAIQDIEQSKGAIDLLERQQLNQEEINQAVRACYGNALFYLHKAAGKLTEQMRWTALFVKEKQAETHTRP